MSHSPSPLDESASEPNLDPEKVRDLFANVLKIDQTLGDHVPAKDVADDADVLKTMLGASAEELEPDPKPTGEDPHDNASNAGSSGRASPKAAATASTRGSSVKPTIAKTRRVPPPSALPLSACGKAGGTKTGKRVIGAPSSKPIASATTTGGLGSDCDDSDGDEVFQSSKYDSEASDNDDANVATNKSASSSRSGKTKRAPRRPKKKESEVEKAERLLREREESKRVLRLQKTQMRSTQLTRRSSALEVLDGLIPLGHNKPNIGFTRQHMVEHAMDRLSQKRTLSDSNDATPTTADKNLDVRVCRYLEKDPEAPMNARERVSNKIEALRNASSVPGALGVLETRRLLRDPEWLPIDDAMHKRKDATHGEFRKLDGAVRELRQQKDLEARHVQKRETWIAAALAAAAN